MKFVLLMSMSLGLLLVTGSKASALTGDLATDAFINRLTTPPSLVPLPPLPANGREALIAAVNAHSASLGFLIDHGPRIRASGIPDGFAGRIAQLMNAVNGCSLATNLDARKGCMANVNDSAAGIIRSFPAPFGDINAWPSLFIDGNGSRHHYIHDYAVLIDTGGDDVYENNAGGNLMDITRGPAGSPAPIKARAIGCEQVRGNFPAPTASGHDCIAAPQVVFIDKSNGKTTSNDRYGVFHPPRQFDHNPPVTMPTRKVDGDCTDGLVIRRIVLQGSGFEGNGLLIDIHGNDKYHGKTAAQGSGHVGGVGVLRDYGYGTDEYLAIRNSQGFSLTGGFGLLQDDGGSDTYRTYMPPPIDPDAPFQADGSGGVIDDTGLCDDLPRMVQGAALLGGVGVLLDQNGRDAYIGAPVGTQPFQPGILFFHSSQGFGCDGGIGVLEDRGGKFDNYREGPAGRVNGTTLVEPQTACFAAPGLGIFIDDGP